MSDPFTTRILASALGLVSLREIQRLTKVAEDPDLRSRSEAKLPPVFSNDASASPHDKLFQEDLEAREAARQMLGGGWISDDYLRRNVINAPYGAALQALNSARGSRAWWGAGPDNLNPNSPPPTSPRPSKPMSPVEARQLPGISDADAIELAGMSAANSRITSLPPVKELTEPTPPPKVEANPQAKITPRPNSDEAVPAKPSAGSPQLPSSNAKQPSPVLSRAATGSLPKATSSASGGSPEPSTGPAPIEPGRYQHQIDYIKSQLSRLQGGQLDSAQRRIRYLENTQNTRPFTGDTAQTPAQAMGAVNAHRAQQYANNPSAYNPSNAAPRDSAYQVAKASFPSMVPQRPTAPSAPKVPIAASTPGNNPRKFAPITGRT